MTDGGETVRSSSEAPENQVESSVNTWENRFDRVLLVGFMGSGKTRVGYALAHILGWSFRDFDEEIEDRVGVSITEIFRQHGEAFFREVEDRVAREMFRETNVVLASGGGWPAVQGRMEALESSTLSVWLRVSAEESIRRVLEDGPTRPLLAVSDPISAAKVLLKEREANYAKASVAFDTNDVAPEELAERITNLINEKGPDSTRPLPPYK